jgi:hypothetical protein
LPLDDRHGAATIQKQSRPHRERQSDQAHQNKCGCMNRSATRESGCC